MRKAYFINFTFMAKLIWDMLTHPHKPLLKLFKSKYKETVHINKPRNSSYTYKSISKDLGNFKGYAPITRLGVAFRQIFGMTLGSVTPLSDNE